MEPKFDHGKYAGCIAEHPDGYQFIHAHKHLKFFAVSRINDDTPKARFKAKMEAFQKASFYQKQYSDSHDLTLNQWRQVGEVIEVKLQKGKMMTCDPEMLKHVEARVWTARRGRGKNTWYASCRESKKRRHKACQFHNLVCPNFKQVDHIDRNGLNNCRSNLREGDGRINAQNKGKQRNNTSGYPGVEWHKPSGNRNGRWKSVWSDKEGKRRSKSFTVRKDEDMEKMKAMAIAHRKEMAEKTRKFLGM